MDWKKKEKWIGAGVFVYALVIYLLTVAPATSFWDSGEFIAIANRLQVSHPPGAPFFMLVGRLFSMFVPMEYIALSINLISVLCSAATILLLHLIIVRLVREWQGPESGWTPTDRISALAGGVIGAAAFAVSDSFWFNAVEAEVYAMSMFFTAATIWLVLRWRELAEIEESKMKGGGHLFGLDANRYLILIAYLFGLAIGIHLLNLLALFFIALIVFFVEFDKPEWTFRRRLTGLIVTGAVASGAFLIMYPGIVQVLPDVIGNSGAPVLASLVFVSAIIYAIHYTQSKSHQAANLVVLCITMVLIGYSTYAIIFIRSAADPPIDENDPETVEAIISYLKREQYGQTPILKGNTFDNRTGQINTDREVLFPRRHSSDPLHHRIYANYRSDNEFFWKYQVGHMYLRYFLWNFVGRASDVQDAPSITGFSDAEANRYQYITPSQKASRNAYFGFPLFLGLIGLAFHFLRDWRRAFAVGVLFFITGIGIILYLNQSPMQPRERDYSYVASFFAFSMWIGIGATAIVQLTGEALAEKLASARARLTSSYVVGIVLFALVPGLMLIVNYDDHDRSGRYVAGDYAYNMLMSVEENAILFTNGDNDTFPLWYLQEVEGQRTDVRVVNLSLLNTPWYIKQLRDQSSRKSAPLPITMSDRDIDNLTIMLWEPDTMFLPVNKERIFAKDDVRIQIEDSSEIQSPMQWLLRGRRYNDQIRILHGADQAALNILITNAMQDWKRPVYFAVTVAPSGQLDLKNYFQAEGQAFRVVPIEHNEPLGRVVPSVSPERLKLFRFTNLNDPDVYYDENIRRMVDNYRNIFTHTAQGLITAGDKETARELIEWFVDEVPFETIPGDAMSYIFMADVFRMLGEHERGVEILKMAEPVILHPVKNNGSRRDLEQAARFIEIVRGFYVDASDFEAAADFTNSIADIIGDSTYRQTPAEIEAIYKLQTSGSTIQGDRP